MKKSPLVLCLFTIMACQSGPEKMGHDLGLLECEQMSLQIKIQKLKPKQQKTAIKKEMDPLVKKMNSSLKKIQKLKPKEQKIAMNIRKKTQRICR